MFLKYKSREKHIEKKKKKPFLFIFIIVFILGFFIFISIHKPLTDSEPYVYAMKLLNQNETVKAYLGDKIKHLLIIKVIINENEDGSGKADMILFVKGEKDKGVFYVNSIKQNYEWYYSRMEFDTRTEKFGIIDLIN